MLARALPSVTEQFTGVARSLLRKKYAAFIPPGHEELFVLEEDQTMSPTSTLYDVLSRTRALYGIGMGFESLSLLQAVVKITSSLRWRESDEMTDVLAAIDTDIAQAIQSSKEELLAGRVDVSDHARGIVAAFITTLQETQDIIQDWGGVFPFERALDGLMYWKF